MSTDKRLFGGNPNKKALDFLDRLQNAKKSSSEPNVSISPSDTYLGDKNPFARMWTATQIQISGSVKDPEVIFHSINEGKEFSYDKNDSILNQRTQNLTNPYLKPVAGITSVSSKSEGALGALRKTVVEFTVHNKKDFETIFLPFFLRPGAMVCVDFGWFDTKKTNSLYDPQNILKDTPTMENFDKLINDGVNDNFGNLEVCIGNVQKYDASIDELGSFKCSLEIVSRNWSLLDAEVTEENNLKYAFTNLLEDSIIKVLHYRATGEEPSSPLNAHMMDAFSAEDYTNSAKAFFDGMKTAGDLGIIDEKASLMGVYYEDVYDDSKHGRGDKDKDTLYISYGFFEDVFLNNLVKSTIDIDGNKNLVGSLKFGFNSNESYIRYNRNIYEAQLQKLMDHETAPNFIYPDKWEKTYNTRGEVREEAKQEKIDNIIPFRELFIRTSLIKKAFTAKHNVNDAVEFIIDALNTDSFGIFKLKMASPKIEIGTGENKLIVTSDTQIGIFDVNHKMDKPTFSFDLTGGVGMVKSADIKFQTPKAGMASMIAISNLSNDEVFYREGELKRLNLLRVLDNDYKGSKVFLKSLPDIGDVNKAAFQTEIDFDFSSYASKSPIGKLELVSHKDSFAAGMKAYSDSAGDIMDDKDLDKDPPPKKTSSKSESGHQIIYVSSPREYYMALAKKDTMFEPVVESISPILPIELSLTVYGNNCLNIGDTFNINYLPDHYKDKVYFQTTGIDHKVSPSGWETTYNTVMRVLPIALGSVGLSKSKVNIELTTIYAKSIQANLFANEKMLDGLKQSIVFKSFEHGGFKFSGTTSSHIHQTYNVFDSFHVGCDFGPVRNIQDIAALWAFTMTLYDKSVITLEAKDKMSIRDYTSGPVNFYDTFFRPDSPSGLIDDLGINAWGLSDYEQKIKEYLIKTVDNFKTDLDERIFEGSVDGLVKPIIEYHFDSTNFKKYRWVNQADASAEGFKKIKYYVVNLGGVRADGITSIPGFILPERIVKDNLQAFCEKFSTYYVNILENRPKADISKLKPVGFIGQRPDQFN